MKTLQGILSALLLLGSATAAPAYVQWRFQDGDAYSRVLCRIASDTEGARRDILTVFADATGDGPVLSCRLENTYFEEEDGLLVEKEIPDFQRLVWGPRENGRQPRRYFVVPEVCFPANGTWRCRKQVHEKRNVFEIDLPPKCPYRVKIGAIPIVWTEVSNRTEPPLEPSGTMLLEDGRVTSNPFSFHPDLGLDGAYYRDLAIVDVRCPAAPRPRVESDCGNGIVDPGESCDDGNQIDDDECSNTCQPRSPTCGDGIVDPGEICDDGNQIDDDGCNNQCQTNLEPPPSCGDSVVDPGAGETCEVGMTLAPVLGGVPARVCRDDCTYCGDGILDPGEACDDGNDDDGDDCTNDCQANPYRLCEMFRDPSFSRDQQGHPRLKANGRLEVIDTSVAGPNDDLVVDIGTERIIVHASTVEEGVIFEREFPAGSLTYFERSGNRGWEHDAGQNDRLRLRINNDYSRFNLELPGDDRMDALLDRVEAGEVTERLVEFQIRFENERVLCRGATVWDCQNTGNRGHCNGLLR